MSYEAGQCVDLTHSMTGSEITVTVFIVSHDTASKQLYFVPIKRSGLMMISEEHIV